MGNMFLKEEVFETLAAGPVSFCSVQSIVYIRAVWCVRI